ncbi:MAG: hypothetical protein HW389_497 [Bacteroidetes bacterium]|nr:hypothetical protein [Bacteroidota bacterium]
MPGNQPRHLQGVEELVLQWRQELSPDANRLSYSELGVEVSGRKS